MMGRRGLHLDVPQTSSLIKRLSVPCQVAAAKSLCRGCTSFPLSDDIVMEDVGNDNSKWSETDREDIDDNLRLTNGIADGRAAQYRVDVKESPLTGRSLGATGYPIGVNMTDYDEAAESNCGVAANGREVNSGSPAWMAPDEIVIKLLRPLQRVNTLEEPLL
jgi:hypothetical protein